MTLTTEPDRTVETAPPPRPWSPAQLLGFRFLFAAGGGLVLVAVLGSLVMAPVMGPFQELFGRIGAAASGTGFEAITSTATGDTVAIWQYHLGVVLTAVAVTICWTLLDRHRTDHRALGGLLWQVGRVALAAGMIFYGLGKAIPSQFVFMQLPTYALQPVGDVSRMNMLWGFMGASDGYSVVTGLVELVSGVLLLWRRTWIIGALGAIVSMTQVVLLDTFYNVPVKFLAFEFGVIAVALLAPVWRNLIAVALGSGAGPAPRIWRAAGADRVWLRRTGIAAGALIIAALAGIGVVMGVGSQVALKQPRSALDGTWTATSFRIDGREATVADRPWTNVAITHRGTGMWEPIGDSFTAFVTQTPDARITAWFLEVDGAALTLRERKDGPSTVLTSTQPDPDHLVLTGRVAGREIAARFDRRVMARSAEAMRFTHDPANTDTPVLDYP